MMQLIWMWLQFAVSLTCWPFDLVFRSLLGFEASARVKSTYRLGARTHSVESLYTCDHSTLSPNLYQPLVSNISIAIAVSSFLMALGGLLAAYSVYLPWPMVWLLFSIVCGYLCPFSRAQFHHDYAFDLAFWDNGERMTFCQANEMMLDILAKEGHPYLVRRIYRAGIYGSIARRFWNNHRDGRVMASKKETATHC
jgi:hypothetical protein